MLRRLLRSGYSPKEISAATKSATTIRKERAETLKELHTRMQSLTLQTQPANRERPIESSVSSKANICLSSSSVCSSPVTTSPSRPSLRGQSVPCWRVREKQRRRRSRPTQTQSPIPLKINIRTLPTIGNSKRQSLSLLRTKTKLSTKCNTSVRLETVFDKLSPNKSFHPPPSPSLKPNMNELERGVLFCASPSMTPNRHGRTRFPPWNAIDEEPNSKRVVVISPPKKLTPIKRAARFKREGFDRPLIMPKRLRTPSP
jgi:hypothetical protein